MKVPFEIKADILKTAMQEDRSEIRIIKGRIYYICSFLTASSFAVTAFIFGNQQKLVFMENRLFFLLIEVSFIMLLWALFARLKTDLTNARKCLQAREKLIRELNDKDEKPLDPFPDASKEKLTITENGLYWVVFLASLALILKICVVWFRVIE